MQPHFVTQARAVPARPEDDEQFLTAKAVCARAGGISLMCLWRWMKDERVKFPQPDETINRRRYWRLGTVRAWEAARRARAA